MKKSILSASIAAMIGGLALAGAANAAVTAVAVQATATPTNIAADAATALTLNEAGTGHILVVPYFTTQGTNATLLNITNTDVANGKLVKVRFRGASNSDDIFDFTLALSPGDVWAAKVSQGADGRSKLETSDKSCTLPSFVATQANSFPTNRLPASFTDAQKANETREGYIEILTMADVPKDPNINQYAALGTPPAANPLFAAIKHVNGVAPCTTTTLDLLKTDVTGGYIAAAGVNTTTAQGKGLSYPTGKLMANWTIIDTVKTATFSGAATAVAATGGTGLANVVFFPQSDDLAGNVDAMTADPLLRRSQIYKSTPATGALASYGVDNTTTPTVPSPTAASTSPIIAASFYDLPDLSTPYTAANAAAVFPPIAQAKALTAALAAKSVTNEYLTTTSIAATTDWVFSSPTRRYNVAMNYGYTSPVGGDGRVYTDWYNTAAELSEGNAIASATDANNFFNAANTSVSNGKICVAANTGATGVNQWDREETTTSSQFVISPGAVTNVRFCGETSVLAINNGTNTSSGSLSASLALQNLNVTANEGWISLGTSGLNSKGLPVLGGAFAKSSAFGAMWPHRYTR